MSRFDAGGKEGCVVNLDSVIRRLSYGRGCSTCLAREGCQVDREYNPKYSIRGWTREYNRRCREEHKRQLIAAVETERKMNNG